MDDGRWTRKGRQANGKGQALSPRRSEREATILEREAPRGTARCCMITSRVAPGYLRARRRCRNWQRLSVGASSSLVWVVLDLRDILFHYIYIKTEKEDITNRKEPIAVYCTSTLCIRCSSLFKFSSFASNFNPASVVSEGPYFILKYMQL